MTLLTCLCQSISFRQRVKFHNKEKKGENTLAIIPSGQTLLNVVWGEINLLKLMAFITHDNVMWFEGLGTTVMVYICICECEYLYIVYVCVCV